MVSSVQHHTALGIHPGAFVQDTEPITTGLQNHILWVDTSTAPPFQLKVWDVDLAAWLPVGTVTTVTGDGTGGVDGTGALSATCLTFPLLASVCNPTDEVIQFHTPSGDWQFDETGITLPGGHRLETFEL